MSLLDKIKKTINKPPSQYDLAVKKAYEDESLKQATRIGTEKARFEADQKIKGIRQGDNRSIGDKIFKGLGEAFDDAFELPGQEKRKKGKKKGGNDFLDWGDF